jgi:predicted regulator of Ras-like GTPase activity (Roadblock/LC7/MglB family)
MDRQALVTEMRGLRERVPGVTGALVAALDGQLVAADLGPGPDSGVDPRSLARSAAASLGAARQVAGLAGQGALGRAVTRASGGYVAVYAVGDAALLAVLGGDGLDLDELHQKARPALDQMRAILAVPKASA